MSSTLPPEVAAAEARILEALDNLAQDRALVSQFHGNLVYYAARPGELNPHPVSASTLLQKFGRIRRTLTPRLIAVASGGQAVTCDQSLGTFATREEINDTLRELTTYATGAAPQRVTAHDRSRAAEAFRQLDYAAGHNADDLPAKYAAAVALVAELEKK